jgi:hypothetical protein
MLSRKHEETTTAWMPITRVPPLSAVAVPYGGELSPGIVHARIAGDCSVFFQDGGAFDVLAADGDVVFVGGIHTASAALRAAYVVWAARDALPVAAVSPSAAAAPSLNGTFVV